VPSADIIAYRKAQGRFARAFQLPQGLFFRDPKTGGTQDAAEEYKKYIVFYPDGHCDELSLDVVDKKGRGCNITLKGFGGTPRIKEVSRAE
jgi:hypothetical protein